MFTFSVSPWLKNVAFLNSLLSIKRSDWVGWCTCTLISTHYQFSFQNLPVIFPWIGHLGFLLLLCFVMWTSILLCGKILQWLDNLLYLKWKSWFHEKQLLRTYNSSADPLVVSWGTSWSSVGQGIGWCFAGIKSELLHPEHHLALLILIHWTPLIMSCFWINKW